MMAEAKISYRDEIAGEIIRRIEAGTAPWQKPWKAGEIGAAPFNPVSNKPYRGINDLWLSMMGRADPRWMTYRQAFEIGAQVRKGERSATIEYWQWSTRERLLDADGKPVLDQDGNPRIVESRLERPRVFLAKVFNAEQIDGLAPLVSPAPTFDPVARAESLVEGSGIPVRHDQANRAFYSPARDQIHLPPKGAFVGQEAYYATLLHELGHATGHPSRLVRNFGPFGSELYAREELRAEIASYMLARDLGISHDPSNHASYVESWLKVLKDDKNEIFRAARDAETIKAWVTEPERRPELERAAQAHAAAIATTNTQEPGMESRTLMPTGIAPEVTPAAPEPIVLSSSEYEERIKAALEGSPSLAQAYLTDASAAYEGFGPQRIVAFKSALAGAWTDYKVPVQDADTLLSRAVLAGNWPTEAAKLIGLTGRDDIATLASRLPMIDWNYYYSDDPRTRQSGSDTIDLVSTLSAKLTVQSPQHAELISVMWDKLAPGKGKDWGTYCKGYVPEDARTTPLVVQLGGDPFATILAAHGLPAEFTRAQSQTQAVTPARSPVQGRTPNRLSVSDRPQLIAVPYAEKDQAKALGAKWDRDAKSWFIPAGLDPASFAKWTQAPAQSPAQTPVQAPEQEPGTLFVGWHTPTIPGKESLVVSQSAGLPSGKFIALDHPFASQAHDPATAKAVEVRLVKVFDPEGIFDPAHIQRDGVLWDAMDAALDKDPDIAKARGDFNEYKRRFAEAQTKFLRSKGYEGYVRWIDGVDREENPEKANRELIVFDRERVKERASPEQSRSPAPEPSLDRSPPHAFLAVPFAEKEQVKAPGPNGTARPRRGMSRTGLIPPLSPAGRANRPRPPACRRSRNSPKPANRMACC